MHPILLRQLARRFGSLESVPADLHAFIEDVNAAYTQTDGDRAMLERSLELTSEELLELNRGLVRSLDKESLRARDNEERLAHVMDTLAEGVVIYDTAHRIVEINDEAAALFGVTREEASERRATPADLGVSFLDQDGAPAAAEDLPSRRVFAERRAQRNRTVGIRRADNTELYVRVNAAPMAWDAGGGITHVIASLTDVTSAHRIERMQSDVVAVASHELRTPLTGILGYAMLLQTSPELPDEARGWAGVIAAEAERLTRITTDLLEAASATSSPAAAPASASRFGEIVDSVIGTIAPTTTAHSFTIRGDMDLMVTMHRDRLSQVLMNLLQNAVKYSPGGGEVIVDGWTESGQLRVDITDSGVGIAADQLPRLFERFHRADDPRIRTIRGTGLGLYLVRRIVTELGGSVSVRSELAHGSTFSIAVPLARMAA